MKNPEGVWGNDAMSKKRTLLGMECFRQKIGAASCSTPYCLTIGSLNFLYDSPRPAKLGTLTSRPDMFAPQRLGYVQVL